jgi:hypothetical protein
MTLPESMMRLSGPRRLAIRLAIDVARSGTEELDDLAFISRMLIELVDAHDDSRTGWCIVAAHKALLEAAQAEGIIPPTPADISRGG